MKNPLLWAVTTYFNYAGFKAIPRNYKIFSDALKKQGVNLLTVELAFGKEPFHLNQYAYIDDVVRLRSQSVLWQKERMINYGISCLPPECKYVAWLDCDILFKQDDWVERVIEKFEKEDCDIIQPFERCWYMPKGQLEILPGDKNYWIVQSIMSQAVRYKDWIYRRLSGQLKFAHPGFAWVGRRDYLDSIGGIFDRAIIGSGDVHFVDGILGSYDLHKHGTSVYYGLSGAGGSKYAAYLYKYFNYLSKFPPRIGFTDTDVYHLYHGELKNRKYQERKMIIVDNNYDPDADIELINNVYEWSSNKPALHQAVQDYFLNRKEDE